MRVAFFGSPEAAVPSLRALLASRHSVVAVVTRPDKPAGRGRSVTATPIRRVAEEAGVPVLLPAKVRDPAFQDQISGFEPEVFAVTAYGQILPPLLLALPRFGSLNVHFSLLPKYRGAAPVQWAILNGDKQTGITIMRMDAGLDTGAILSQLPVAVSPEEDAPTLESRLAEIGPRLLVDVLDRLEGDGVAETPQDTAAATHAPPIRKGDGEVDWTFDASRIQRMLLAFRRWPGVFFTHKELPVKLIDGVPGGLRPLSTTTALPGQVLSIRHDGILVACGTDGGYCMTRVQPAGRGVMDARSFANGYRLFLGDLLT